MEPMDPETKESILANAASDATESDVDEYERLLAARFTRDPNMPETPPSDKVTTFDTIEKVDTERRLTGVEIVSEWHVLSLPAVQPSHSCTTRASA
jgi:hypothetical protein